MNLLASVEIIVISLLLFWSCRTSDPQSSDQLGSIEFDVTVNEKARPDFEKGLLLLHSFEYVDSREAFLQAQEKDPSCVMAVWGEAMTYNHNLWQEQDFEKAREALLKLGETKEERMSKATTEIETDFLEAIEILYESGKEKNVRDKAYANHLGQMMKRYPDHHEVAAFYAIGVLGAVEDGRDETEYEKAAQVAKEIIKQNPNHPGALHYLIHSYDDPDHATMALHAANNYSIVAPDAAHALHMPSHIFVAMGMWDEVVSSNIASWEASVTRKNAKDLDNDALGYHSFHWLQYGLLQKGNLEKAKEMVHEMAGYADELPSKRAKAHLTFCRSTYLVESDDWNGDVYAIEMNDDDMSFGIKCKNAFITGAHAFHNQDEENVGAAIARVQDLIATERNIIQEGVITTCANVNRNISTQSDLDIAHVCELELQAYKALLQNQPDYATKLLAEAADLEETISYSFGPPWITKPSFELLGETLLTLKRYEEAMTAFDRALQRAPKRVLSLKGMKKAATGAGDLDKAKEIEELLQSIQAKALI